MVLKRSLVHILIHNDHLINLFAIPYQRSWQNKYPIKETRWMCLNWDSVSISVLNSTRPWRDLETLVSQLSLSCPSRLLCKLDQTLQLQSISSNQNHQLLVWLKLMEIDNRSFSLKRLSSHGLTYVILLNSSSFLDAQVKYNHTKH